MSERFKELRYKLAYLIAPDWFDDIEHRFSSFLSNQTGGRMSKTNYTVEAMIAEANDYQQRICEECDYYLNNELANKQREEDIKNALYGEEITTIPNRCISPVIKYCFGCRFGKVSCILGYDQGRPEDEPTEEELKEFNEQCGG